MNSSFFLMFVVVLVFGMLVTLCILDTASVSVCGERSLFIGVTAGGFNKHKFKPPPSITAQSLSVYVAQSASASVLTLVLMSPVPLVG